jgi:NH3-dependent NAD+ synthetase
MQVISEQVDSLFEREAVLQAVYQKHPTPETAAEVARVRLELDSCLEQLDDLGFFNPLF